MQARKYLSAFALVVGIIGLTTKDRKKGSQGLAGKKDGKSDQGDARTQGMPGADRTNVDLNEITRLSYELIDKRNARDEEKTDFVKKT